MLFLLRARPRLGTLSLQCRRCYYHLARDSSMVWASAKVDTCIGGKQTEFLIPARCFAAPVQAKPKPVKKTEGPRLNNEITHKFIRLVTDDGHAVVSIREALDHAMKLKLDLVEVQPSANPPVCKIMDFNKEKYKQQLKDKERAKKKSQGSMLKGIKEVRFSIKAEQKDLQFKADLARRLLERGYRVKCIVTGTEDQDLGGMLSRLFPLIEDISVMDARPQVARGQAHMIVRHVKFGFSKKSGKKAGKAVEPSRNESQMAAPSQLQVEGEEVVEEEEEEEEEEEVEEEEEEEEEEDLETIESSSETMNANLTGQRKAHTVKETMEKLPTDSVWSNFDTKDDSAEIFDFDEFGTRTDKGFSRSDYSSRISKESKAPFGVPSPKVDSRESSFPKPPVISSQKPDHVFDFRAKTGAGKDGKEPTNRIFTPGWIPPQSEQSFADKNRLTGKNEYSSNQRIPPKDVKPQHPPDQSKKSGGFNANQAPSPPSTPGPTLSSYGIFSAKIDQRNPAENIRSSTNSTQNSNPKGGRASDSSESKGDGQTHNDDKTSQGGWGAFSKPTSNPNQNRRYIRGQGDPQR